MKRRASRLLAQMDVHLTSSCRFRHLSSLQFLSGCSGGFTPLTPKLTYPPPQTHRYNTRRLIQTASYYNITYVLPQTLSRLLPSCLSTSLFTFIYAHGLYKARCGLLNINLMSTQVNKTLRPRQIALHSSTLMDRQSLARRSRKLYRFSGLQLPLRPMATTG